MTVRDLQLDEVFGYVQKKEVHKRPNEADAKEICDAYTFIGLERTTNLVVAWHLGKRDRINTEQFLEKVRKARRLRPASRLALTPLFLTRKQSASSFGIGQTIVRS